MAIAASISSRSEASGGSQSLREVVRRDHDEDDGRQPEQQALECAARAREAGGGGAVTTGMSFTMPATLSGQERRRTRNARSSDARWDRAHGGRTPCAAGWPVRLHGPARAARRRRRRRRVLRRGGGYSANARPTATAGKRPHRRRSTCDAGAAVGRGRGRAHLDREVVCGREGERAQPDQARAARDQRWPPRGRHGSRAPRRRSPRASSDRVRRAARAGRATRRRAGSTSRRRGRCGWPRRRRRGLVRAAGVGEERGRMTGGSQGTSREGRRARRRRGPRGTAGAGPAHRA